MKDQRIIYFSIISVIIIALSWYVYTSVYQVTPRSTFPEKTSKKDTETQSTSSEETTPPAPVVQTPAPVVEEEDVDATTTQATTSDETLPEQTEPEENEVDPYVQDVFAQDRSERCTWVDRTTGHDGMALIRNGKVLVETEQDEGNPLMTLYNSTATYVWVEGADEGTVIPNDLDVATTAVTYQTRPEVAEYLRTNEWVDCDSQTLSDSHFTLPRGIDFTQPSS